MSYDYPEWDDLPSSGEEVDELWFGPEPEVDYGYLSCFGPRESCSRTSLSFMFWDGDREDFERNRDRAISKHREGSPSCRDVEILTM